MARPPFSDPAERVRKWGDACAQHLALRYSFPLIPFLQPHPDATTPMRYPRASGLNTRVRHVTTLPELVISATGALRVGERHTIW